MGGLSGETLVNTCYLISNFTSNSYRHRLQPGWKCVPIPYKAILLHGDRNQMNRGLTMAFFLDPPLSGSKTR